MTKLPKCQTCNRREPLEAIWAWQPLGPDENPFSFTARGKFRGATIYKNHLKERLIQP